MTGIVKTFQKAPVEKRRLYLDYDCWLEDTEQLTSFQTVITPNTVEAPLLTSVGYVDVSQRKLVMFVQGGVNNTNYVVQMVTGTDEGQIRRDDIGIWVTA